MTRFAAQAPTPPQEPTYLHDSSSGWFSCFLQLLTGPRLRTGPRPNSTQGDPVSRRADPPSQDRRSLGYLVSSPPLASDHGSRLHQLSGGAACRLSASHHLDMTRPQRIAVTAFLSALFVPSLFLLPVWCLKSEGIRSLLWDLSSSAPPLVNTVVAGAIPLIVFGVLCSVFAWVVARIWR